MADVTPRRPPSTEMQDFVHRSSVRSGLKREFAFALKAQTEMLITPRSRTRSGRILHSSTPSQEPTSKRPRKLEPSRSWDGRKEVPCLVPLIAGDLRRAEPVVESAIAVNLANEQGPVGGSNAVPSPIQINGESATEIPLSITDSEPPNLTPSLIQVEIRTMEEMASSSPVELRPLVESPAAMSNQVSRNFNGKSVTYVRRFTRSLLNSEVNENSGPGMSVRISTLSSLKSTEEESSIPTVEESPILLGQISSAANGGPDGFEATEDAAETANGSDEPLEATPKKKMVLKMSKISSTKNPSNVKKLLGTGLLEGLNVKYVTRSYHKKGGLCGVIKDGRILCFCSSCQGLKTVSAYHFELHAGSTKKHPSENIYLENGSSIRDVIRACMQAPLDTLELTIRNAISSVGAKSLSCGKCKEPSDKLHNGTLASVCESCLLSKLSPKATKPTLESADTSRLSKPVLSPNSPDSNSKSISSQKKNCRGRMTTKDVRLHKLVFMDGILPDGTEVAYYARGQRLLQGYIKGSGIFCHCCNAVVSPSQFEAHAGCPSRRKPYLNIYTSNGVSLHELSVSLSKDKRFCTGENDDLCRICADGGDLLLCDLCPRAFHKECVGLTSVPKGDWYCPYCQNMHQKEKFGEHNENAIAAGRVAGVDPIEEIIQRCIRIVKTPETDIGGCVLCRGHDFSKSGFGPRTVILCDQCEREFHVGCLKDHSMGDLKELPEGKWFCSPDCSRIHAALQRLLTSEPEQLPSLQSDVIKRKLEQKGAGEVTDLDIRWRLLSGKAASPDSRLLLAKALSMFHESFDPIIDLATGKDLIPAMVYGRDMRDQEFGGMYCSALTVNSSVVSAGILRVLGCEVAELPLVATSRESQGQGYFQSLFSCIERMLNSLEVKHLVLPAADEAESIWTKKFGFSKITIDELNELAKGCRPTVFHGTSMLHKLVAKPPADGFQEEGKEGTGSTASLSPLPLGGRI
ncbi:unnamed protein product [Spirodela intermedia]|uniref:PHD-type domain-containing protein n=1 Tax=Spirodela intermedia TaxID=51605 RepID=A0A7I8K1C0_SPIIN|nr:unnamed protein product [Spirodela intermedia]